MKKFLLTFFVIFTFASLFSNNFCFASSSENYIVVANTAYVYQSPSLSANKIALFKNRDKVVLEMLDGSPETSQADGYKFYKLKESITRENESYSYILADLVVKEREQITSIPNFNGKTNAKCNVYFAKETENGVVYEKDEEMVLSKGTAIFLYQGFNKKSEYNAVSFLKDNTIYYGYLQTKNISPNGVNPVIITCIFLIIAVLGIVFAWVFISKKKVKLKRKNIKSEYNLKDTRKK